MSAGMIIELKPPINVPDFPPSPAQDDYSVTSDAKYPSSYEHKDTCSGVLFVRETFKFSHHTEAMRPQ